jgi:amino acid transporter
LLTDYILTVAVSVSAGVAALYSAFPAVRTYKVPVAVAFIAVIAWGNLRGVKESGRIFALPTYGFLLSMFAMIIVGLVKATVGGGLEHVPVADPAALEATGAASLFLILHAFASGGAAMTGVEAISNGVPAFKPPEWKNARSTLMVMGSCLGVMFIGISWLATKLQVVPNEESTVIAQIAKGVFGGGALGHGLFLVVQAMTMLILVLAANTSFADFPRLASFHADDAFMPKQLTKRGHRLVFSNGIIALAGAGAILVVVFRADVTHLIPLYAIGVFTSFTLSQTGMAIRHLRIKEKGWRVGLLINGSGAVATGLVTVVIGMTKFVHGAWFIMILVPVMVAALVRLNRQYESEREDLESDVRVATSARILRHHTVLLLVNGIDRSTARALQYARTLTPDELRAVHIALDPVAAADLVAAWAELPLQRVPLEVVDCPDRRLTRGVLQVVAEELHGDQTEVTVLVPRREYSRLWHRLLHDRSSDAIARVVATLPHANVTFVPYHLGEAVPR